VADVSNSEELGSFGRLHFITKKMSIIILQADSLFIFFFHLFIYIIHRGSVAIPTTF
jgi:hypothetical protein